MDGLSGVQLDQALRTVLLTGEMIHKHTHSEAQPWDCSL